MPKAVHSNAKGLVQSSGVGSGWAGSNNGAGLYRLVKEIDFNGQATGTTDNETYAAICELPANSAITRVQAVITEAFQDQNLTLEIQAVAAKVAARLGTTASETVILSLSNVKTVAAFSAAGHFDVAQGAQLDAADHSLATNTVIGATKPYLYLAAGASNIANTSKSSGKILIIIECITDSPILDLNLTS